MYSPFFPHVEEAWALKDQPNMLFIFYEDMKADLRAVIARVSHFLEAPLSKEQVESRINTSIKDNSRYCRWPSWWPTWTSASSGPTLLSTPLRAARPWA